MLSDVKVHFPVDNNSKTQTNLHRCAEMWNSFSHFSTDLVIPRVLSGPVKKKRRGYHLWRHCGLVVKGVGLQPGYQGSIPATATVFVSWARTLTPVAFTLPR